MDTVEIMKEAALKAGKFLRGASSLTTSTEKSSVKDFVTEADLKVQDIIRDYLAQELAGTTVLSEEDSEDARQELYAADFSGFVIDPIDGTYNFKHGMQESAISIGYIEHGEPLHGVIYDTYKDELYVASKGRGAQCNGKPISVSGHSGIAGASIATCNSYDDEAAVRNLQRQIAIYEQSGVMPWTSCPGSAVLVLAWIAAGRIDAIHHNSFKPWDNAAGFVIVPEAGGKLMTTTGEQAKFTDNALVVGNPVVVEQLLIAFEHVPVALLN
jgi:myo-inositol-1(or 4)-monophosphatase